MRPVTGDGKDPKERTPPAGIEQSESNSGKTPVPPHGGAESGAVGAHSDGIDADLRAIIDAWPTLPEADSATAGGMILVLHMAAFCGRCSCTLFDYQTDPVG